MIFVPFFTIDFLLSNNWSYYYHEWITSHSPPCDFLFSSKVLFLIIGFSKFNYCLCISFCVTISSSLLILFYQHIREQNTILVIKCHPANVDWVLPWRFKNKVKSENLKPKILNKLMKKTSPSRWDSNWISNTKKKYLINSTKELLTNFTIYFKRLTITMGILSILFYHVSVTKFWH